MSSLAESEKRALLRVARNALNGAVGAAIELNPSLLINDVPSDTALLRPGGAFVTISRRGRLRGCIGQLPSQAKLVQVVAYCADAVASKDARFPRVNLDELPAIQIELSILSNLRDIQPGEIEPGKHGLLVSNGSRRGVLLPQVAEQFYWNGVRFLEATCEKAGLARDAWKNPETGIQAFTAEVFSESEFLTGEAPSAGYSSST
jgi:AmmeMemoRadiSam system protein A